MCSLHLLDVWGEELRKSALVHIQCVRMRYEQLTVYPTSLFMLALNLGRHSSQLDGK